MSLPKEHIEQLISEEISGIITPEGQAFLDEAKANPKVYKLWKKKHAAFKPPNVQSWLNQPAVPSSGKKKRNWPIVLFVVTIAITVALYFLNPLSKKTPSLAKAIELRLQNGTVIDLSQEGKTDVANISLNKQPGSLTYSLNTAISEWATLSVPAGKDYKVTLSDGTEIFMNVATTLSFPTAFNHSTSREVTINGEAYLKVAQDPNRPFTVKMGTITVLVLGTEFNVNSYNEARQEVALVRGKIQLQAGKDSVVLKPGSAGVYVGNSIQTKTFDEDVLLAWRKGIYLFENKTLEDVLKEIHRVFGQEVVLDNPAIAKQPKSGALYKNDSIQKSLDLLNVAYFIDKNNIIHIK